MRGPNVQEHVRLARRYRRHEVRAAHAAQGAAQSRHCRRSNRTVTPRRRPQRCRMRSNRTVTQRRRPQGCRMRSEPARALPPGLQMAVRAQAPGTGRTEAPGQAALRPLRARPWLAKLAAKVRSLQPRMRRSRTCTSAAARRRRQTQCAGFTAAIHAAPGPVRSAAQQGDSRVPTA